MAENDNTVMFQDFDRIEKFKNEVIKPIFPNVRFGSSMMVTAPGEPATSFEGNLSTENLFKDTDYEYKGEGEFLHYTSLFGIKGILETGFFRMSEFGNLVDKEELLYGLRVFENNPLFQYDKNKLKHLKENIFCLSACQSNEKTKRDAFMWEVYGDKGKGVLIEFEFTKKDPNKFLLGKVQYGNESLKPLKDLKIGVEKFAEDEQNILPNNFSEFLMEMQSFHKSKRYKTEKEVRLFLKVERYQYDEHKLESIYKDINSNQEVKYFNKLFLKGRHPFLDFKYPLSDEEDAVFNEFPQIEIKNIILGFNISDENQINISYFLKSLRNTYNYDFKISYINDEGDILDMSRVIGN
jgi:hypothetical protein